jgi:hypothetical protein
MSHIFVQVANNLGLKLRGMKRHAWHVTCFFCSFIISFALSCFFLSLFSAIMFCRSLGKYIVTGAVAAWIGVRHTLLAPKVIEKGPDVIGQSHVNFLVADKCELWIDGATKCYPVNFWSLRRIELKSGDQYWEPGRKDERR